jgi:hypothetical protein
MHACKFSWSLLAFKFQEDTRAHVGQNASD